MRISIFQMKYQLNASKVANSFNCECVRRASRRFGVLRFFWSWLDEVLRQTHESGSGTQLSNAAIGQRQRPFWSALWHAAKSPERNTTNATMPKVRLAMGSVELDPRTRRADVACPAASTIRPTTGTTPFSHQRFKARALTADGPVPLRPSLRSSPSMSSVARWTRSTTSATCP